MKTDILILLGLIALFVLLLYVVHRFDVWKAKIKYESYVAGKKEIANSMADAAYWIKGNPQMTNYLWIMSHHIKEFQHFDIDGVRNKIVKLGNTKVHDLPMEQRLEYFPKSSATSNN